MLGWFRRHAKILMVVLGSAAMAIFGLGPVFDELAQRGSRTDALESQVVATWDGGKVTRIDLEKWERSHWQAQRFLSGLRSTAETKKGDRIRSLATPIPMLKDGNQDSIDDQLIGRFLLSERAKAEGVVVSDGMVEEYILLSAGDVAFSNRDLDEINREVNQNCSLQKVKEHLKFELLASQMQQYASAGIPMVPNPTEAIELYARSQEKVECEVLAVNVDEYIEAGDDVSANELKKVYEQGKYDFVDPTGENPGFKVGPKLNIQYLKADFQVALTNEMNKLTDAEVQAEYDRLVAEKSPIVMEAVVEDNAIQIDTSTPDTDVVLPGESEAQAPEGVTAPEGEAPSDVVPPPTGTVPAVETPAVPAVEASALETPAVPAVEVPAVPAVDAPALEVPAVPAVEVPAVETPAVEASAIEVPAVPAVEVPAQSGSAVPATEGSIKITKSRFQFVSTVAAQETPVADAAQAVEKVVEAVVQTQAPATSDAPVVESTLGGAQAPVVGTIETPVVGNASSTQAPVATPPAAAPVVQTPVVETPVVQTPAVATPAVETPAVATPAVETPVVEAPVVEAPAVVGETASQVEASEAPAVTTPAASQEEEALGGLGDIMESAPDSDESEAEDNLKPKPLVDVQDAVKRSMCQVAARKAMEESLTKASVLIQDHFHKMMRWEEYNNKKGDPPAALDFEAMAAKYGLVFSETGMVDDVEVLEDPIGRLGVPMTVQRYGRRQQTVVPVGQLVFNDFGNIRLFDAQTVNDLWGSQDSYLFWVQDKAKTRVPDFEDCRDEVEKFVKQKKAFELAMTEAESMKKKVNDIRGKTLAEVFGDRAVPTGAFSWFTNFGSTRYGVPSGVKAAGEDFMETAFSLAKLEAGVAPNASKDVIYVVQAIEPARAMSEAGHDFLANQYFKYKRIPNETFQVGQRYVRELSLDFNQNLQDEMGFKFIDR